MLPHGQHIDEFVAAYNAYRTWEHAQAGGGGGGGGGGGFGGGGASSDPWSTPAGPSDEPPF